jgi:hypothetical protein
MRWIGLVLTVIVGILAYRLRKNCRWVYGAIEIVVGLLLMIFAWFPPIYVQSVGVGSVVGQILAQPLQIIVGIYAFVQGLENFFSGVAE